MAGRGGKWFPSLMIGIINMDTFNGLIPAGFVVVATEGCYNDNNGAYDLAHCWNGEELKVVNYANCYNRVSHDAVSTNATEQQIKEASSYYINNVISKSLLGSTVVLQRSRKAPNKVELVVVDTMEGGYNSQYNNYEPSKIAVLHDGCKVWVNESCIKEVVKGCYCLETGQVAA